jgi:hypothetical protein
MPISLDTDKILTSLTALGMTLLGATSAHAGMITVGTDVTEINGVASASFPLTLPGADTFRIEGFAGKTSRFIQFSEIGTYGHVKTARNGNWDVALPAVAAQKWSAITGNTVGEGTVAGNTVNGKSGAFGALYTDAYFDFIFKDTTNGNQLDYGWIELSLIHQDYSNLDVRIVAYAWEPDGSPLAAGATTSDATPEPPSGPLSFLTFGAMALGAAGVRRWKAALNAR